MNKMYTVKEFETTWYAPEGEGDKKKKKKCQTAYENDLVHELCAHVHSFVEYQVASGSH